MNKFITKVAKLVLGLSLAAGVGVAVGGQKASRADAASSATTSKITIDCSSNGDGWVTSKSTNENTFTVGSYTFGYKSCYFSSSYVMMRKSAGVIYNKTAIPNISSITFTYSSGTSEKAKVLVNQSATAITTRQTSGYTDSLNVVKGSSSTTSGTYSNSKQYLAFSVSNANNIQVTKIEINYTGSANMPSLTDITCTQNKHTLSIGNQTGLTLSTTPSNAGSNVVNWTASPSAGVSFSSTTGNSTIVTFPSGGTTVGRGVEVTITATLSSVSKTYKITSIGGAGTQASPYNAAEAKALALLDSDTGSHYVSAYIVKFTQNNDIWLSDNSSATSGDFELYGTITNNTNITPALGHYILASGTFAKYGTTTAEATNSTIHRIDVITLAHHELFVNYGQSETLSVSSAGGDVVWSTTAGTGSVTLSNQSNSSVTIAGTTIGTATVTATVGTASASCAIEVREYATDWTYVDLILTADGTFNDTYYQNGTLNTTGLSVTLIEHSNTLNKNRETDIELEDVTFNFDANKGTLGTFTLTATYQGHTTDDAISVHIIEPSVGIEFNSNGLAISTSTLSGTANDSNGVAWTATAVFSNTVSITTTSAHCQVGAGSASKRADSVSISMNLGSVKTFTSIAFKVNAFSGDSGDITMKLDGTEIATGSIDGTTEVIVGPSNYVRGQALTILIENEGNLRVNLISCEYYAYTDDEMVSNFVRDYMHMDYDEGGVHGSTGGDGSCKSQGWYSTAKTNYNKLFDPQKSLFNSESKYSAAKQRLIDWAVANEETFDPSAYTFTANSGAKLLATIVGTENTNTIAIIVIISLVSVTVIGGYFFIKRREEN